MIISRTPYRVSFFGGGTDFPEWFSSNGGAVLSTSIDRYCYITCRELPRFFDHKHRIVYSKTETVASTDEIEHPAVREAFRLFGIEFGVELHHHGDLPACSGVGSSSAFAVGVLNGLRELLKQAVTRQELAAEAVRLEREILHESVGLQDQYACALGGLNYLEFGPGTHVSANPLPLGDALADDIASRMVLVYSGQRRMSSDISQSLVANLGKSDKLLGELCGMAARGRKIFEEKGDLDEIGGMLHEAFRIKATVNPLSVTPEISQLYQFGMERGALGGKVLGAGGGGFVMFWLKAEDRPRFVEAMKSCVVVPARPEREGAVILFAGSSAENSGGVA